MGGCLSTSSARSVPQGVSSVSSGQNYTGTFSGPVVRSVATDNKSAGDAVVASALNTIQRSNGHPSSSSLKQLATRNVQADNNPGYSSNQFDAKQLASLDCGYETLRSLFDEFNLLYTLREFDNNNVSFTKKVLEKFDNVREYADRYAEESISANKTTPLFSKLDNDHKTIERICQDPQKIIDFLDKVKQKDYFFGFLPVLFKEFMLIALDDKKTNPKEDFLFNMVEFHRGVNFSEKRLIHVKNNFCEITAKWDKDISKIFESYLSIAEAGRRNIEERDHIFSDLDTNKHTGNIIKISINRELTLKEIDNLYNELKNIPVILPY